MNPYKNFIMHLDVMTYDQNVQRVTISNIFKKQDTKVLPWGERCVNSE